MSLPDYYKILEIPSQATLDQIKQAYRRLARLYHPDVNKNVRDTRIKQINEAYTILSDTARRAAYDVQRLEQLQHEVLLDFIIQQRELNRRAQKKMTWAEGAAGFVRELRREMHN